MKNISLILLFLSFSKVYSVVPQSDELMNLHNVNTFEMNAITSVQEGSLIFNTDDHEVYERNATAWKRISSDGSETKIIAGTCMEVTGTGSTSNPYVINSMIPGKTQATAEATCKVILDTGCAVGDGIYWINPDGGSTANAFEVYCDMTTDGGGWTRIDYAANLTHQVYFSGGDSNQWLPNNFVLNLTDTQINQIRALSTEGKQRYHGTCQGVIHHYYAAGNSYNYAFGFRYHTGAETTFNQQTYPGTSITVVNDGCQANNGTFNSTDFDIVDIRVPVINVHSRDNGNNNERFGSPLTSYPAWLR